MITFKELSIKNFLSFGNVAEVVDLTKNSLTLIQGLNKDKGENKGLKNGVGKSSIVNGIHYALFGMSINNKIKKTNLPNKTNKKECEVSLEFIKDGTVFLIERGRNPEYLRFYVDGEEQAQGENKETQSAINEVISISSDLFNQIILLTTYVDSFLDMSVGNQRDIIEEMLGITLLSEKAEKIKALLKETKHKLETEKVRVDTIIRSNQMMKTQHEQRLISLNNQKTSWDNNKVQSLAGIQTAIDELAKIDIVGEEAQHKLLVEWTKNKELADKLMGDYNSNKNDYDTLSTSITRDTTELQSLQTQVDIGKEEISIKDLMAWEKEEQEHKTILQTKSSIEVQIQSATTSTGMIELSKESIQKQIDSLVESMCPTCNQAIDKAKNDELKAGYQKQINDKDADKVVYTTQLETLQKQLLDIKLTPLRDKPTPMFNTLDDLYLVKGQITEYQTSIKHNQEMFDKIKVSVESFKPVEVSPKPMTYYSTIEEVYEHKNNISLLQNNLTNEQNTVNTFVQQIKDEETNISYQEVDNETLETFEDDIIHQEFLIKMLTDKNSFIRKAIIEENLEYLNQKLQMYLEMIDSPHEIIFNSDMSVDIMKNGEEYDFANLSRGEKGRVGIALSLAFREAYENLNDTFNLMFVDEIIDNGLDVKGVEDCIDLLSDMANTQEKNIFVVSHREEVLPKVSNVMTVVMEDGFSEIVY